MIERGGKIQHLFVDLNVLPAYSFTPVKTNQMNALTHFPFSLPPPSPFCPYFSQAALFKKQKNSALTQCVALKVFIKHDNHS